MVCERVAFKKANPAPVQVVLLHLQGSRGSFCGLPYDQCLFSSLASHDEERFCRQCLAVHRKLEAKERAAARKAWRALPWGERVRRRYEGLLRPHNVYDAFPAMFLAMSGAMVLAFAGVVWIAYRTAGGWYAAITFLAILVFLFIDRPPRGRL